MTRLKIISQAIFYFENRHVAIRELPEIPLKVVSYFRVEVGIYFPVEAKTCFHASACISSLLLLVSPAYAAYVSSL